MIGESIHPEFRKMVIDSGYEAMDEGTLYKYFDVLYDYDIFPEFQEAMKGNKTLEDYIEKVNEQEEKMPMGYCKLRYIENHDMPRIMSYFNDKNSAKCGLALIYLVRGMTFLYNGIETFSDHQITLFDKDDVVWEEKDSSVIELIKKLSEFKKDPIFKKGIFNYLKLDKEFIAITWENKDKKIYGLLNLKGKELTLDLPELKDGIYKNILEYEDLEITDGKFKASSLPQIIEIKK